MDDLLTCIIAFALDFLLTAALLALLFWALGLLGITLPFVWSWKLCFGVWIVVVCLRILFK